jgi:microcystin-dependent protein
MNANGNFFIGNKKVNSATGTEELFDIPIPSVTGEDPATNNSNTGFNVLNTTDATVSRSLFVEGGANKDLISKFDGPVILNNKIISNSSKGIEALSLFLKGTSNTPRQYTVGESIPTNAGSPGDVQYNANPLSGGFLGWVYTSNNRWEKFGRIGSGGGGVDPVVGVSSGGSFVGLSTLIDFKTTGIVLTSSFDSASGITTLNFAGASPLGNSVGVSTGSNTFVGMATQFNFAGTSNILVSGTPPASGIVTINVGLSSSAVITAGGFVKSGVTTTNFLKAGGADAALTSSDVTNALGFTPANSASVVGDPASGNSVILDSLAAFDGVTTIFNLNLNGSLYTPFGGSANLIVSLGGITQKPGSDYYVNQNAGINTSSITFTTAPAAGLSHFIVALGGQSSLLGSPSWNAKGDLAVGITDNNAGILTVGTNGQVLTVDSTQTTGVGWSTITIPPSVPTTTVVSVASTVVPTGFLECNGASISRTTYAALFAGIGTVFGTGIGTTSFNIPNLRGEFIRGWDNGRGIDSGRVFGSAQSDLIKRHYHNTVAGDYGGFNDYTNAQAQTNPGDFSQSGFDTRNTGSDGVNALGTETRPRNIALMFCIKF